MVCILREAVAVSEGSFRLSVLLWHPSLSLFDMLLTTGGSLGT
jgi:hypothetical protein